METVLVVGGAGYVGSVLVPILLNNDYKVDVIDTFWFWEDIDSYVDAISHELNSRDLLNNLYVRQQDIRHLKSLPNIYSYIINLACISNDPSSDIDPDFTYDVSYNGVINLINLIARDCKNIKKFIQASSDSVYGIKSEENVTEELEPKPLTQYSTLKLRVEQYLKNRTRLPYVIVRPSTVCGYSPRQRLDLMINIFIDQAVNNGKITLHGGEQYRPFINIRDMCRVYLHLLNTKNDRGEIYNAGHSYDTAKNYASLISSITNAQVETIPIQDNRSYRTCSDKLCSTGFKFFYNMYDTVRDLSQAFKENKINRVYSKNIEVVKNLHEINSSNIG